MTERPSPLRRRARWPWALSLAAHAVAIWALLSVVPSSPPPEVEPDVVPIVLAPEPFVKPPEPPPAPEPQPKPEPAPKRAEPKPVASLKVHKPKPAPREVAALPVAPGKSTAPGDELGEAEVAGAATAEGGAGGGGAGCNMARWLQTKLRTDPKVQSAMAAAYRGKPLLVWNGAWIQREGEEGEGLAAVREAIMWEVAFAPEPCRHEPVRGFVLLKLAEGPSPPRVVLGHGSWRWSDLLFARSNGGRG